MSDEVLHIWYRDRLVGRLTNLQAGTRFQFAYDASWVKEKRFRLSAQLPVRDEAFGPDSPGARFFGNLIPEGVQRERWVRELQISDNDFALLKALGRDCAGAFSILPDDVEPSLDGSYVPLSDAELAGYCLRKGKPGGDTKTPVRFSLAGYQDKLAVHVIKGRLHLPQGAAASSEILKFDVPDFSNVPLYEAFLTELYRRAEAGPCEAGLKEDSKKPYLAAKRFDRYESGEVVERLHQEDFCQALGYGRAQKYELDKGPKFQDCVTLLRQESAASIQDIERLLKWLVLNALAGNSDGHAKNLALLQDRNNPKQWRLAPFYDLVCTGAVERLETKLAFSIGGQRAPNSLIRTDWENEAVACGLQRRFLADLAGNLAAKLPGLARELRGEFEKSYKTAAALQRVSKLVNQRCRVILKGLEQTRKDSARPPPEGEAATLGIDGPGG